MPVKPKVPDMSYVFKALDQLFRWRTFWLGVLLFMVLAVYSPAVNSQVIGFLARQKPPFSELPPNASLDIKTTIAYKKEKAAVVRTNLKNVVLLVGRDLGLVSRGGPKLVSASLVMPVVANVDKGMVAEENRAPRGDVNIIRDNLLDALKSYVDMLTVRIVSIDNKPVLIGDSGTLVPFDKTDHILQWAGHIDKAAKKYQIDPAIIAAIIEQESGGDPRAVSRAGAIGLMQLMPGTAKWLGVDPYDPQQNIDGGTRYFVSQYKAFDNLGLALAAYNAGPNNVRNGDYLYLPETQGYMDKVPRLAEKYQRLFAVKRNKI